MKTFKCRFNKETMCTVEVTDEAPAQGETHIVSVAWDGPRGDTLVRPYMAWMNTVNQQLADEWKIGMMHCFVLPTGEKMVWTYTPGCRPDLMLTQRADGKIIRHKKRAVVNGEEVGG